MRSFAALVLLHLLLSFSLKAQYRLNSYADDLLVTKTLVDAIDKQCEADIKSLAGDYRKYKADIYKKRAESIKNQITANEALTAADAQTYLSKLAAEIISHNPILQDKQLRILFSRSFYANAASMGEGTIFFNIGLFHRLDNEAQAAFALCHEMAHYLLNHGNHHIDQYIQSLYSSDFQKKLKTIQRSDYGQNKQLDELVRKFTFSTRRHSREFEAAADSMALELLKNTAFDVRESVSLLGMLDSTDKDKYNVPLDLERRFNFSGYPFKKRWLESDDLSFRNSNEGDKPDADSLKTHPDCQKRIAVLSPKVKSYYKTGSRQFLTDAITFERLKKQFDYEIIEYCYRSENISRALYFSLEMLNTYPTDAYLNTMVGKCLNDIYTHQKAHNLNKIAERPATQDKDQYNLLLQFIQNLSLADVAALSQNFLQQQEASLSSDAEFQKVYKSSKAFPLHFKFLPQ